MGGKRKSKGKIKEPITLAKLEEFTADKERIVGEVNDLGAFVEGPSKVNHYLSNHGVESDDEGGLEAQLVDITKVDPEIEKRKKKKERQKLKRRARKMAEERRASEISLGGFLEESNSTASVVPPAKKKDPAEEVALIKCPIRTLKYSAKEIGCKVQDLKNGYLESRKNNSRLASFREALIIFSIVGGILFGIYSWLAFWDPVSVKIKTYIVWYVYWIFLGILSSVGLGTGLHTFILYLGPFIAKVSLAAQECSSLDFPMPPYPHQITCSPVSGVTPSVWAIASKVRFETLAWGFGTALGELPPYFIARAARLTGDHTNPEDLDNQPGCCARMQRIMRDFVMKIGFWGILVCASIPNPLFDLAGITCGHFQVPFAIFFGATAIGKTIVKSQLQMFVVILAFNDKALSSILKSISKIPWIGTSVYKSIKDFMDYQRAVLRNDGTPESAGILKTVIEVLVILVIAYFVISIINSLAKSYSRRLPESRKKGSKQTKSKRKTETSS